MKQQVYFITDVQRKLMTIVQWMKGKNTDIYYYTSTIILCLHYL